MMKLYCSTNSPYARKVRVVARELGIADQIQPIDTDPRDLTKGFPQINPVSKIPALIASNGDLIIDSPVICEYLNDVYGQGQLLPSQPEQAWKIRSLVALADGIQDAGMAVRLEGMRPPELQSEDWVNRQFGMVKRGIARMEAELDQFSEGVNLVGISLACTIEWLKFRFGHVDWMGPHPKLTAWLKDFAARDSMQSTVPGKPL